MYSPKEHARDLITLIKRGLRAIFLPHRAFKELGDGAVLPQYFYWLLVAWGPVFIFLNFLFAQRTLIFQWNHAYLTLFVTAVYSFLIWRIASYFFFAVAWWFGKKITLSKVEYGAFYFWITWAIMPFFDLPHLLFDIPMVFIAGAGAHLSWIYGFPALSIVTYFILHDLLGFNSQKENRVIAAFSAFLPFGARYGIEMIPQWIHFVIRHFFGREIAPGFHYATLVTVLITLFSLIIAKKLIQRKANIKKIIWSIIATQGVVFSIWILTLSFVAPLIKHTSLPPQTFFNSKYVEAVKGISRHTHSFTWTGNDLESGTITHGPQAASAWWQDEYADAVDLDFNPDVHTIKEINVVVHYTSNTDDDSPTDSPRSRGCVRGGGGASYYCSSYTGNLEGASTTTFTINAGNISTYVENGDGVATSTEAWEALIDGFTQDDNDVLLQSRTLGSDDSNVPTGDVIEFDVIYVSIDYYDNGELHMATVSSTAVTTTTSQTDVLAMTLASSSLPSSTYLVVWGAQIAGNDSSANSAVKLVRASSSQVTISDHRGEATAATADNPPDGNSFSGFWLGHLNGLENLSLYYRTINASDEAYLGTRFIHAIKIEPALIEDTDYWTNGAQESATVVLSNVGTTYTTVTSTTKTFDASQSRNYIVLASMEVGVSSTADEQCSARIVIDGTTYNASDRDTENASDVHSYTFARQIAIGSGSKTISLQGKSESTASCDFRRPRIYVFRSDTLASVGSATSITESSDSSGNYVAKVTLNYTPSQAEKFLVIGNAMVDSNSDTRPINTQFFHFQDFVSRMPDFGLLNNVSGDYWTVTNSYLEESTSTNSELIYLQYRRADGSGSVDIKEASVIAFSQKLARHYEQSGYGWYENDNSTSVGSPLAATNTAATAPEQGTPFRLRLLMHIESSTLTAGSQPFKLQFAEKSGTCDTSFSGETYVDVEHDTGTIRFYNNSTPSDAVTATATSTDPTHSGHTVIAQGYEERNTFTATSNISPGQDGMWDFSLVDSSATPGTSHCFRIVKLDDTQLNGYDAIPEIQTTGSAPTFTVEVTLNDGSDIVLAPATTTRIYASSTVSDADGVGDISYATSTFYRSGVGSSCVHNGQNCYQMASSSCVFGGSTTTVSCYADIWYFAQATGDASSSFPSQSWQAAITITDKQGLSNSTTSAANIVNIGLITAIDTATGTLSYGTVTAGSNTGTSTTNIGIINYGNTSTTLKISGTDLTFSSETVDVSNQHYASSTFTYGENEQSLSTSPTTLTGVTILPSPHAPSTTLDTDLPEHTFSAGLEAYNDYVYVIGGNATSDTSITLDGTTSTVWRGTISSTGTVHTWTKDTSLPFRRAQLSSARHNNYLYVAGGLSSTDYAAPTSSVLFTSIKDDGTLNTWESTTALPSPIFVTGLVTYNNYLYAIGGGLTDSQSTSTVLYAPINATGSIGAWSQTTALPSAKIAKNTVFAYNNYMYQIANSNVYNLFSQVATTTALFAPINSNGTLGSWSATTPVTQSCGLSHCTFNQAGGVVHYIVLNQANIYYSIINSNGTLSSWSTSENTLATTTVDTAVVWNGNLYINGANQGLITARKKFQHLKIPEKSTFWGLNIPLSTPAGTYSGTITITSNFSP